MEGRFYHNLDKRTVQCDLCNHSCRIEPGATGLCRVRRNTGGVLLAETYNRPAALQVDPIEKKPLAFYKPGSLTFSVGTFGCNLACQFCQNAHLARHSIRATGNLPEVSAEQVVELARRHRCESVALTYNEPTVFFEYAMAIAQAAHRAKLAVVLVSNGYIKDAPRRELYRWVDAANIDIKGFGNFYGELCRGTLEPVLESCRYFKLERQGHLEITNLLIPGYNDSESSILALLEWVGSQLGCDTPLHFSAYHPAGGFEAPATPATTLLRAQALAEQQGFSRIILGNMPR